VRIVQAHDPMATLAVMRIWARLQRRAIDDRPAQLKAVGRREFHSRLGGQLGEELLQALDVLRSAWTCPAWRPMPRLRWECDVRRAVPG
jgi:hypothetical protein